MPFPTVNAVLQLAYAEARNKAKKPVAERGSPVMLEAISNLWSIAKDHLPASDAKVRRLDEFITQISSCRQADGQV
jgi:hypothetical protein